MKDFLCGVHLLESVDGRINSLKDGHFRENPSNNELLAVRGIDRRVLLKMFGGMLYYYTHNTVYRPAAASHTEMNIALIWHNLRGEAS